MVAERIKEVTGSLPEGVRLCAVSKYHPAEMIQEAYDAGQRIFGESHVQELQQKHAIKDNTSALCKNYCNIFAQNRNDTSEMVRLTPSGSVCALNMIQRRNFFRLRDGNNVKSCLQTDVFCADIVMRCTNYIALF